MPAPADFYLAVKSTIDYIGASIAADILSARPTLDLQAVSLDDAMASKEVLSGPSPAVVWSLAKLDVAPCDPLYSLICFVGAKTTSDTANELLSYLMGAVQNYLPDHQWVEFKDYSGDAIGTNNYATGRGYVLSSGVDEQAYDNVSSLRLMRFNIALTRTVL